MTKLEMTKLALSLTGDSGPTPKDYAAHAGITGASALAGGTAGAVGGGMLGSAYADSLFRKVPAKKSQAQQVLYDVLRMIARMRAIPVGAIAGLAGGGLIGGAAGHSLAKHEVLGKDKMESMY